MKDKLERTIEFRPAFDKRDPEPSKNYGIHGMEMKFIVKGRHGATQFGIYTNWMLEHVEKELDNKIPDLRYPHCNCHPSGFDIGYHAKKPNYKGQTARKDCPYIDGTCYYDGSTLAADDLLKEFIAKGVDVVWKRLEDTYKSRCVKLGKGA